MKDKFASLVQTLTPSVPLYRAITFGAGAIVGVVGYRCYLATHVDDAMKIVLSKEAFDALTQGNTDAVTVWNEKLGDYEFRITLNQ